MNHPKWLTNDSNVAKALIAIDKKYNAAREAASYLPLDQKVIAYREARQTRQAAYSALHTTAATKGA